MVLLLTVFAAWMTLTACGREGTELEDSEATESELEESESEEELEDEDSEPEDEIEDSESDDSELEDSEGGAAEDCPCNAPFDDFRDRDDWWHALAIVEAVDKCVDQLGAPAILWGGPSIRRRDNQVRALTCVTDRGIWTVNHPTYWVCYTKALASNSTCDQVRR